MLGVIDYPSFVDEHDRNIGSNLVAAPKSRVVQKVLISEVQQRALILRTRKNFEKLRIERHKSSLEDLAGRFGNEGVDFSDMTSTSFGIGCFKIET